MPKMKYRSKTLKTWKRVLLIILSLFLSITIIVSSVVFWWLSKIKETGPSETISPSDQYFVTDTPRPSGKAPTKMTIIDPSNVSWPDPVTPISREGVFNILLVGQDRREGESRQRSDAMIVVSYDTKDGTVKMVSLLRDLYVQIPGYNDNRLNAAYAFGGFDLLTGTIKKNFGIDIDGCFEADFSEFTTIVNILGGIDITLTKAEAEVLKLSEGQNHLDGEKALEYSRIRYIDSDFQRTLRQRKVMTQIIYKVSELSTANMLKLMDRILPYLSTNLSKTDILSYAYTIMKNGISEIDSTAYFIPSTGTYKSVSIEGMSVLLPDIQANRALLKKWLYKVED